MNISDFQKIGAGILQISAGTFEKFAEQVIKTLVKKLVNQSFWVINQVNANVAFDDSNAAAKLSRAPQV